MNVDDVRTLLRDPAAIAVRCLEDRELERLGATCLVAIALGGAVFGAVVGTYRGGLQIPIAALKIPVAMLATFAVCGPGFYAFAATSGRPWSLRTVLGLVLAAGGRASLLLLAFAPVLGLAIDFGAPYGAIKLGAVLAYGLAGLSALRLVVLAASAEAPGSESRGRSRLVAAAMGLVLVAGGQMAWVLRPYFGDPRDTEVPVFVQRAEGGLLGALVDAVTHLSSRTR